MMGIPGLGVAHSAYTRGGRVQTWQIGDVRVTKIVELEVTGGTRIILDTCLGNDKQGRTVPHWNDLHGPFLQDLAAAGFTPDTIDTVLCTHLHVDHVGWNTMLSDGAWVPTFPRARYLMARPAFE